MSVSPGAEIASLARGAVELPGDVLGWLDRGIIDLPPARIASLKLTGADGATLAIRRDGPDAAFAIADLPAGRAVEDRCRAFGSRRGIGRTCIR